MNKNEIVVLFSGGTDSTLAAALVSQQFSRVHLVTYRRFGFFRVKNSTFNVHKLQEKYGQEKFSHAIIDVDAITRFVFYSRYFYYWRKFGFFLLSNCGLCKLAMHMQTILYCLDNQVAHVCDGANQGMNIFPAQMKRGVEMIKDLYAEFGVMYSNPVFDFDGYKETGFVERLRLDKMIPATDTGEEDSNSNTAGSRLYELGLMPSKDVKGSRMDHQMQGRCFQLILFNIFVKAYYLYDHSYDEYEQEMMRFYSEKVNDGMQYLKKQCLSKTT
ncbi:MAG: 7-cyano-7-deazaguanine synthase [Candidatus Omnitrophica bacterium]|nr:7-cyano-7-deazaguanine synthase [Candidatus Omnitrophota bacterium]